MTVTCVVQARMGSTRFPGKVLADLGGEPMLRVVLRRVAAAPADSLVVATSEESSDDPVEALAADAGIAVVRGPEHDVLARFGLALDRFPADRVVRVTGDCPLVDPALIVRAIETSRESGADYVSNTLVRTYPDGLDVEVVTSDALRIAIDAATDPVEREHVTPYVYRRPERFELRAFRTEPSYAHLRWTVDTPEDLEHVRALLPRQREAATGWNDALERDEEASRVTLDEDVRLVVAAPSDADRLRELRNDSESVRFSRTRQPVTAAEHATWFSHVLERPSTRVWMARLGERVVGSQRVDVEDGVGRVSIVVDPAARGRGIGARMLSGLEVALSADEQVHTLVAEVHRDNTRSQRLFERAGYQAMDDDGEWVRLRRTRQPVTASTTSEITRGT